MQGVVVHSQQLLVVVLAGYAVGDLVEVHQLIHEDDQAAVTRAVEEEGEELEVVVPVVVRDGHVHTQIGARLGLVGVFAAEPVQHLPLQLVVTLGKGTIVKAEQTGKVEAVHQVVHRAHHSENLLLYTLRELRAVRAATRRFSRLHLHRADPSIEHIGQRSTLGLRLYAEVLDQFAIRRQALSLIAIKASLGREVGVHHHKISVHHIVAHRLQQEGFPAAIVTRDEAERCAALADNIYIAEQRLDLLPSPHRDVGQSHARHHASLE